MWVVLWLHVVSLCCMLSSYHGCVPYCCVPCCCSCVLSCHGCTISCPCTMVAPWVMLCELCCESSSHYGCMLCCCVLCHCVAWVILMPWLCYELSLYYGCTVSHCTVSHTMWVTPCESHHELSSHCGCMPCYCVPCHCTPCHCVLCRCVPWVVLIPWLCHKSLHTVSHPCTVVSQCELSLHGVLHGVLLLHLHTKPGGSCTGVGYLHR